MVAELQQQLFTEVEYLALEAASDTKHAYVNGQIIAMAGATPQHNQLAVNTIAMLHALARGRGCVVLNSDQRVHVPATGLYTYPDVAVVCGERQFKDDNPPSLLNPAMLVEVTSKSTEDHDRGAKFLHYQSIAALREYVIVSHREPRIDHYRRLESGQWLLTTAMGTDGSLETAVLGGFISASDVYEGVDLEQGLV